MSFNETQNKYQNVDLQLLYKIFEFIQYLLSLVFTSNIFIKGRNKDLIQQHSKTIFKFVYENHSVFNEFLSVFHKKNVDSKSEF